MLQATISSDGNLQLSDASVEADVVLDMPFSDLPALVAGFRENGMDGIAKQMQIQGDAGLAQLLADLARTLRWDIEADLASLFGDVAAVRITSFGRAFAGGLVQTAKHFQANIQVFISPNNRVYFFLTSKLC